ncbi:MAG: hypothetical protein ACKO2P_17155 [Planctomycetota bacterium]
MNLQRAVTLCVLLLSAAEVGAQQRSADSAGAGSFTVIGDVDRPGNFRFAEPITVRSAVASASPVSDAVNVTVLRNGHDRAQSTRLLRLSTADSGEQALSGDLYVVESLAQPSRPVLPNAVLRTPAGTTVISLEDAGVVIGDVLQGLGMPVTAQTRIAVPCRIRGQRSLESAPLSASVQHGDVITASGADALTADGTPAIRPMMSEWRGSAGRGTGQQPGPTRSSTDAKLDVRLPVLPPPLSAQTKQPTEHPSEIPRITVPVPAATVPATSRVVIVGDPPSLPPRTPAASDVLILGDSLRVPSPPPLSSTQPKAVRTPQDRGAGTTGRNVSGKTAKVPVTAAVSTNRETVPSATPADAPASDSLPKHAPVNSSIVHWAVIVGLFVAGVWVLARSLSVGSVAASKALAGTTSSANQTAPETAPATSINSTAAATMTATAADSAVPWRIYSVPQAIRSAEAPDSRSASADELDLLIANRIPIERTRPQLPTSIELSGRPSSGSGQTIRRIDSPHTVLRGRHAGQPDPGARRGRPLEERLSQLIRSVSTSASGASGGADRTTGSSGAER